MGLVKRLFVTVFRRSSTTSLRKIPELCFFRRPIYSKKKIKETEVNKLWGQKQDHKDNIKRTSNNRRISGCNKSLAIQTVIYHNRSSSAWRQASKWRRLWEAGHLRGSTAPSFTASTGYLLSNRKCGLRLLFIIHFRLIQPLGLLVNATKD